MLDALDYNQVCIFVKSVVRARTLNKLLNESRFPSVELHSGMDTKTRVETYDKFKRFQKRILVSTDLTARGIDIEKVNIVFNYDFPKDADTYLHRVGRAGRFGNRGMSISFLCSEATAEQNDKATFEQVQQRFRVKVEALPDEIDVASYLPRQGDTERFDY